MRVKAKLHSVNNWHVVTFLPALRAPAILLWRAKEGMVIYHNGKDTTGPNERLEGIHASAVAFVAMTGSVEGFPEQEFDL
jgi:hypothetical protein